MVQASVSQRLSPADYEREALTQQYTGLALQYAAVSQQLGYASGSEKVRKEQEAEVILQQMKEIDAKLKVLDAASLDRNRQYLNLEEELRKIDFTEAKQVFETVISKFDRSGGNASFLLQGNFLMAGNLCLLEVKDWLRGKTKDLKFFPVRFSADVELNHLGLLNQLASHLGIAPIANAGELAAAIQQTIVRSLQSGSVVLLEIQEWDALPAAIQRDVLGLFLEQLWLPLVAQLPAIAATYSRVRFIAVLVVEEEIAPDCRDYCCVYDEFDAQKLIELPLQNWTEDHVLDWLDYLGLPKQRSEEIAKLTLRRSYNGVPKLACEALREALKREFANSL